MTIGEPVNSKLEAGSGAQRTSLGETPLCKENRNAAARSAACRGSPYAALFFPTFLETGATVLAFASVEPPAAVAGPAAHDLPRHAPLDLDGDRGDQVAVDVR